MVGIILDCYTDEPSGLGVPPYIGTYPRYIAGALRETADLKEEEIKYLTIDDLRMHILFKNYLKDSRKTNIRVKNLSKNYTQLKEILKSAEKIIVVGGVQTPGKYLGAVPGTLAEISRILSGIDCKKILAGPAALLGTRLEGGKKEEHLDVRDYDEVNPDFLGINKYENLKEYALKGAFIVAQHPNFPKFLIAEIETGKGCPHGKCSFCTEPLKNRLEFREQEDILAEVKSLKKEGINNFRLGKQSCFYSYKNGNIKEMQTLLEPLSKLNLDVLHIDNANPAMVTEEATKIIAKHCTPGNVAALGIESFDHEVIEGNCLNSAPETSLKAIRTINKYGGERGANGMPKLLPGINILFGLANESKRTHECNMVYLKQIFEENLLIRRINIRQVALFKGTPLEAKAGTKFLRKNNKYYWKWRNEIRQNIDFPMLKLIVPEGTVLRHLRTEIHDGNTTFARQIGTYPLIVGIEKKLPLDEFVDVRIKKHMLRSVVGEVVY